jgi:ATP synthase protein I
MASWLFFVDFLLLTDATRPADEDPAGTSTTGEMTLGVKCVDDRRVVPLTLLAQIGVSLGLAALLWVTRGWPLAASVLLGGAAAFIPNGYLGARLLAIRPDATAAALMRSAWIGEIGKLLLTIALFAVIFAFIRPSSAPAVFGGFMAAQLVVFGALLIGSVRNDKTATKS